MTFTQLWTKTNIKEGFERFRLENGRLPTALEIDELPYLPTARQIQRAFGGLKQLREELGYEDLDFSSGHLRSAIALRGSVRGLKSEKEMEVDLVKRFGELYVHTEKRYGRSGNRVDFMVFTPEGNIGIDVFFTDSLRTLQNNLNIKIPKYLDFPKNVPLYFVCANPELTEVDIDYTVRNMSKLALVPAAKVIGLVGLSDILSNRTRYKDPANFVPLLAE
jgi:hypothetical protein